jgi:peptide/nickel transport system substrate-binding protein
MGLAALATFGLALSACTGGGNDDPAEPAQTPGGEITAAGEGVTINDAGGEMLALGTPVQGGSLRVGMQAPVESLDPTLPVSSAGTTVAEAVFDTLLAYDAEGNVVPELAESMETTDDGSSWTMTLPDDVTFTDGTPFNAEAVVAHLERVAAEGSRSREAGDVRQATSMTAADEYTVEFTLAEPSLTFPKTFTGGNPSTIPSPTAVAELGEGFALAPVGAGPFMVQSFTPGGNIDLVANPDYRIEELPYLEELTFVTATDSQARLSAAQSGDIDIAPTQVATDFAAAENAGLTVLEQPMWTYYNLMFNLAQPPFDDVRFREAVIHGIDLEGLNQAVFDGLQTPMTGMFVQDHPFYVDTDWPAFDPEAAQSLVEEYTADTGVEPSFTLVTTSPPEFQRQAAVMQQMLADVGITMEIEVQDQPTMISSALAGNFQAQHRFIGPPPETDRFLSARLATGSPANGSQGGNPELDALFEQAKTATAEERGDIYAEMQQVLREWLPMMPIIQHAGAFYVGDQVAGFPGSPPGATTIDLFDTRYVWAAE